MVSFLMAWFPVLPKVFLTRSGLRKSMRTRSTTGLAILAGGLTFVGAASATDLIVNGGFESVTGGSAQYGGLTDGIETG